ncbi:MAG: hydroxymethylglutaryl-CoA lyase [Pararhodobacter sp.]
MATDLLVCDVTPRDGLQLLPEAWSVVERVALIDRLSSAGVRRVEAVSFVNPARVPQMADAEAVLQAIARPAGLEVAGLVMNARGVERALATELDEIRFVIVASETFSQRNQGAGIDATMRAFTDSAARIRQAGRRCTAVIAVAFGCPFEGEIDPANVAALVEASVHAGADEVLLADTIGVAVPMQVLGLARRISPHLKGRRWGLHLHNTRNTGYANALFGLVAGASVLDAATGGLGGCPFAPRATGNIATEDLVWVLKREQHDTGIDLAALTDLSQELRARVPAAHTGQVARAGLFPEGIATDGVAA